MSVAYPITCCSLEESQYEREFEGETARMAVRVDDGLMAEYRAESGVYGDSPEKEGGECCCGWMVMKKIAITVVSVKQGHKANLVGAEACDRSNLVQSIQST